MIFGRPTNLWLGFTSAVVGFGSLLAVTVFHQDGATVATVAGGLQLLLGAAVSLIANQPPTVNPGDTVQVTTPAGQPTASVTIPAP